MRKTAFCLVAILLAGVLVAPPASATFGAIVQLPAGTVYSPYGGPATVTFTFAPDDVAAVFTVRLRQPGHAPVKEKDYLVDPATQASPHPVDFPWRNLSVTAPTDYVIDVRPQGGGGVITSETFTLLPKLVSDLSATPSPFYPLVQDGYKDDTKIGFWLASDAVDTIVHVFKDDEFGRCCGAGIRTEDLGALVEGAHDWLWDGAKDDASAAPKGTYFARVEATDTDAVSTVSKAQKVVVTKGLIRLTATESKAGSTYSRVADEHATALGGDCNVMRDRTRHQADIVCANADISVYWKWDLGPGERIESVSFQIDDGVWGCHKKEGHTPTESVLRVHSPPTSTCGVMTARI
ncbi:MAG: FlgD immunoglobulin-like domain containing protein, partial [Actinomycetota bacterium]